MAAAARQVSVVVVLAQQRHLVLTAAEESFVKGVLEDKANRNPVKTLFPNSPEAEGLARPTRVVVSLHGEEDLYVLRANKLPSSRRKRTTAATHQEEEVEEARSTTVNIINGDNNTFLGAERSPETVTAVLEDLKGLCVMNRSVFGNMINSQIDSVIQQLGQQQPGGAADVDVDQVFEETFSPEVKQALLSSDSAEQAAFNIGLLCKLEQQSEQLTEQSRKMDEILRTLQFSGQDRSGALAQRKKGSDDSKHKRDDAGSNEDEESDSDEYFGGSGASSDEVASTVAAEECDQTA